MQCKSEMELENSDLIALLKNAENIKDVVRKEIGEYDADKTARSDYALESAGLQIILIIFQYNVLYVHSVVAAVNQCWACCL